MVDPAEINRSRERSAGLAEDVGALDWLTDRTRARSALRQAVVLRTRRYALHL